MTEPDQQTGRQVSSADDPAAIRARVDELMSQMTPAEKAGQLTQYFYFRLPAAADIEPALGLDLDAQPRDGRGGARARRGRIAAVPDRSGRDQPAPAAGAGRQPSRHPAAVRLRCHPRAADHLPGPDRHGRLVGSRDHRTGSVRRRPGGPCGGHPLGLRPDGGHRPGSAVGPDRRGRGRGSVPGRRRRRRPGPRLPRRGPRHSRSASSPAPNTSPGTGPPSAGGTTTR